MAINVDQNVFLDTYLTSGNFTDTGRPQSSTNAPLQQLTVYHNRLDAFIVNAELNAYRS